MQIEPIELITAWQQVRNRSPAAGVDGITLDLFAGVAKEQLRTLKRELEREYYQASPAKGFYLKKKSGGQRLIGIPTVRDRVVQRLTLQSIYPTLETEFPAHSYGYRPGHSVQMAIEHFSEYYRERPTWVIKADIAQFFDSLIWAILLESLEDIAVEQFWGQLIAGQLQAGIKLQGQWFNPGKGVLQGGILSGALANLYLSEFDRYCADFGIQIVRYGDDFVIATGGLLEATRILAQVSQWLEDIYLTLQPEKTHIFAPNEEFVFLGYKFQAGEIIPPPSKSRSTSRKPKQKPAPESRPPKACSILKPYSYHHQVDRDFYWSDSMTTLYVTEQGAYLKVRHQQFQVFYHRELRITVPVNRVSHIVLFGCCNLSHGAVQLALKRRIPVMYLSHQGRYFGRLQTDGMAEIDYLLLQMQRHQEPAFQRRQAEAIVMAKLHNSRKLLLRMNRSKKITKVNKSVNKIAQIIDKLPSAKSVESLLGYEGQSAHLYYQALGVLFNGKFTFEKRTRRPPTDPINSMLSLGYTLLHQNVFSLVQAVGLHTHFGNLHTPRRNHPALVSDLIEEFRAPVVDSFIAYLVNSKIFKQGDFTPADPRGGVYLHPSSLRKYLKHWQEKLQTQVTHPHTGYKVSYYRCLELQVWEYIACLKGEQEVYRPMMWNI